MTRDEFMKIAENEIDQILVSHKNRMMNIVTRAWAEGKRNAETEELESIVREVLDNVYGKKNETHQPDVEEEAKEAPPHLDRDGCVYWDRLITKEDWADIENASKNDILNSSKYAVRNMEEIK